VMVVLLRTGDERRASRTVRTNWRRQVCMGPWN
jgi:hypothetical protein